MKRKTLITGALLGAVSLSAIFGIASMRGGAPPVGPDQETRISHVGESEITKQRLDQNENRLHMMDIGLARMIFGNGLDYPGIQIHKHAEAGAASTDPDAPGAVAVTASATEIHIWGSQYHSDKYNAEKDPAKFGAFIQGVTGLWQQATGLAHTRTDGDQYAGSRYAVGPEFVFSDYGAEQQRAMMEDYALRFLHSSHTSKWLPQSYGQDSAQTDAQLGRIVEAQFPQLAGKSQKFMSQPTTSRAPAPGS